MVPGSTLMYGSSLTMLIVNPRASSMAPRQADVIPFPNEETTPPVINTYDVMCEPKFDGALLIAESEKQERAGAKARLLAWCFLPTLRIPRRRWTKDGVKRYQAALVNAMR